MNRMVLGESAVQPTQLGLRSRPNAFTKMAFFVGLLFHYGGAFLLQMEYVGNEHSPSKILQFTYLGFGLFGAVTLITASNAAKRTIRACKPIFYLVALGFVSVLWSTSIGLTLKACLAFLMTNAFALALPVRLGDDALPFVIRSMAFACFLSIVWLFVFPEVALHHATDLRQNVHAGLWRGIFTHKQTLGTFAGFTVALILFYGRIAFPNVQQRIGGLACAIACLEGSQSATGFVIAVVLTVLLYVTYAMTKLSPDARTRALVALGSVLLIVYALNHYGALSFVPVLLGKTEDLTGRGEGWQMIESNFAAAGAKILTGGGFGSEFPYEISEGQPIDNGYILKMLEFGYVGSFLLFIVYGQIFRAALRLLINAPRVSAGFAVFPTSIFLILILYSITETGLMERNITTILLTIAVYITASRRVSVPDRRLRTPVRQAWAMGSALRMTTAGDIGSRSPRRSYGSSATRSPNPNTISPIQSPKNSG